MKKLNNKQVEAISSSFSNLGNILFLGLAVTTIAVAGISKVSIGIWIFSLLGWFGCQTLSVWTLSFWRKEDGSDGFN